jgi:[protein-PII] uridylyltransferase
MPQNIFNLITQKIIFWQGEKYFFHLHNIKPMLFNQFLYLLTVADIRATKEDLWNDWKDALLKKLFYKTKEQLQNYVEPPSLDKKVKTVKKALAEAIEQVTSIDVVLPNLTPRRPH